LKEFLRFSIKITSTRSTLRSSSVRKRRKIRGEKKSG
jgi:hypothetical protein